MSAQSTGISPLEGITKSAIGWRAVSFEKETCTRKTGILFSLKALASFTALEITVFVSYGSVDIVVIPFWRSMTTRAVFALFRIRSLTSHRLANCYIQSSIFHAAYSRYRLKEVLLRPDFPKPTAEADYHFEMFHLADWNFV